jgi:regulator of sigma E protease
MKVSRLATESPAKADEAGLKVDDQILAVNGTPIKYFHQFIQQYETIEGDPFSMDILRGKDTLNVSYVSLFPQEKSLMQKIFKPSLELPKRRRIGFEMYGPKHYFDHETQSFSMAEAIPGGMKKSGDFLMSQLKAFKQMFANKIKASESLGSFISIGRLFGAEWDWKRFWNLTAMLSILLGFINLLPIPALDGGHVMFLLFEVITGIKPSDRVIEVATMGGFIILVMLMIYAIGLDISRLF